MPFKTTSEHDDMPVFYNVTMAVGANAPNRKADVMLIQYFLKRIY